MNEVKITDTLEILLFISGTGGDLRNKPNQFDSPSPRYLSSSLMISVG